MRRITPTIAVVLACLIMPIAARQQAPQQPSPRFRGGVTVVPVDVRVLDRDGRPVTDLRQQDFTVLENGVAQRITQFFPHAFTAQHSEVSAGRRAEPAASTGRPDVAPQNRRVVLIVLGLGRLAGPSKELDAALEFTRQRLLPQDFVAVAAFNRATDFTIDHERAAQTIERFRTRHEKIHALMAQHFSGLQAAYGSDGIPPAIQTLIDEIFQAPRASGPRELPGAGTDASRISEDTRRQMTELQRAELLADRTGAFAGLPDPTATVTADLVGMPFDEYVSKSKLAMFDLGNIYRGVEYLRAIQGEKHLVFVTPSGLFPPRVENDKSLAAAASDSRVAIDILYTGGVVGAPPPKSAFERIGGATASQMPNPRAEQEGMPTSGMVFEQIARVQGLRELAQMTGGQVAAFTSGASAFRRLAEATRFEYLLGYSPTNAAREGDYRRIVVKVNRPGVTVSYRGGYFARDRFVPIDRRSLLTQQRIGAAAGSGTDIRDIEVTIKSMSVRGDARAPELALEVAIGSLPATSFTLEGDRHAARLDITVFCGDAAGNPVGEMSQNIDLKLREETWQGLPHLVVPYVARVRLHGDPKHVKVIAYNYDADRVGTASAKLK